MVVVVTGSASGIGLGVAQAFLKEGHQVVFSDLNQEALEQVASTTPSKNARFVPCDVANEDSCQNLITQTQKAFNAVDVLINNAGFQHVAFIEDFPTDIFEKMLKVELVGPFMLTKYAFPIMKAQKFGRILNMASINGLVGFAGKAAYNSAKHGLIGLTKVCALEGAPFNITANALCPGYVDTPLVRNQLADLAKTRQISQEEALEKIIYPLIPQKRLIAIEDIAQYALFLVSDAGKNITGQACVIDGGYTAQ
ncbi:3-hydroxybutyrate dehydrogenase [Helicobacter ailurogastricus]|uniref:3-hydroxybutyrate dehydrogenase n=1 Tax=Helicobacter ailurogastricus TaxID=1578720 RepID=UPI0022BF2FE3|nr:3-hydroxybutyrate dehydrogenase [Helicobacter ailurogastricus]GLH58257.1 3-hydroxybutyrate dehydrogenase [Helicobacter ailurogastricus]GLH59129.1 3-hydroxybutyrate dehydrogenase [Helicobacter ailurogastricus]